MIGHVLRRVMVFLLRASPKSVCLRWRDSVFKNLWVVKNHHASDIVVKISLKFQLFPKKCCSMKRKLLKRSFCEKFYLLLDKSENFRPSEILRPRVRIGMSACWIAGFAFLTVRFSATAFTVGGQFPALPELEFFRKKCNSVEYGQNLWKRHETTTPIESWMKRFFRCVLKHSRLQRYPCRKTKSPPFKFNLFSYYECYKNRITSMGRENAVWVLFRK